MEITMKIEKNKVVAISYCLQVEGKVADKAGADAPLEYVHGKGMLLPKFEAELEGKEEGDGFAFTLTPEEGYGVYNPAYKVEIPKSSFEVDGKLREDLLKTGNVIPMLNGEGQVIQGTIAAIGDTTVTMDFNHPMAGKTLNFTGKVESVREATPEEKEGGCGGHCKHGECKHGECGHGECGHEGCDHEGHGCGHCKHEE